MDASLVFCGDTMLAAGCLAADRFARVREIIQDADFAFCNLETSLATRTAAVEKRHVLISAPENLEFLTHCGFELVNLANNHILDQGLAGGLRTIEVVKNQGLKIIGLQEQGRSKAVVLERAGMKVGFLGYADYGFQSAFMPLKERVALADVAELRQKVDCVVVSLHWGFEYVEYPCPSQQAFARRLIDAGAQLIIGHHPHVMQGIEEYRGGLIAYSLGNFQFKIDLGEEYLNSGTGMILRVRLSPAGALRYEAIPLGSSRTGLVERSQAERAHLDQERIDRLSRAVNGAKIGWLFWLKNASRIYFPMQLEAWRFRIQKFGGSHRLRLLFWLLKPINFWMLFFYLFASRGVSEPGASFRGADQGQ